MNTGETTQDITVSEAGTYTVTYEKDCDIYTDSVLVITDPDLLSTIDLGADQILCDLLGGEITLNVNTDLPNYLWNTGDTSQSVIITHSGTYWVTSETLCKTISDTINITNCEVMTLPNAFSPNQDGFNDVLQVLCSECEQFISLTIYNRWGEVIFNVSNYDQGWDGKYLNEDMPIGSYAYILRYNEDEIPGIQQGNITLIR